jgi:hypothetical protein
MALFNRNYIHLRLGTRKTGLFKSSASKYEMINGNQNLGFPNSDGMLGVTRPQTSGSSIGQFEGQLVQVSGSSIGQSRTQAMNTGVAT